MDKSQEVGKFDAVLLTNTSMNHALKPIPASILFCAISAQAAITITIQEKDGGVVVAGSGTMDTFVGLNNIGVEEPSIYVGLSSINPSNANIDTVLNRSILYQGLTGPTKFGPGGEAATTAGSASYGFGIRPGANGTGVIVWPESLGADTIIQFEIPYPEETLESMGIESGFYQWTWGTAQDGVNGGSVTMNVIAPPAPPAAAIPALSAFGLVGLAGAIGAAGVAMNRRRKL